MRKQIAGIALIATVLVAGGPALADTNAPAPLPAPAPVTAPAPQVQLPAVSLTPDSLLYGLKLWFERIELALIQDAAIKGSLLDQQAQIRMAEAKAMADAGKLDLAQQALAEAKTSLSQAQAQLTAATVLKADAARLTKQIESDRAKYAIVLAIATMPMPAAPGMPTAPSGPGATPVSTTAPATGSAPAGTQTATQAPATATVLAGLPVIIREKDDDKDDDHDRGSADAAKAQNIQIMINPGVINHLLKEIEGGKGGHGGRGKHGD